MFASSWDNHCYANTPLHQKMGIYNITGVYACLFCMLTAGSSIGTLFKLYKASVCTWHPCVCAIGPENVLEDMRLHCAMITWVRVRQTYPSLIAIGLAARKWLVLLHQSRSFAKCWCWKHSEPFVWGQWRQCAVCLEHLLCVTGSVLRSWSPKQHQLLPKIGQTFQQVACPILVETVECPA